MKRLTSAIVIALLFAASAQAQGNIDIRGDLSGPARARLWITGSGTLAGLKILSEGGHLSFEQVDQVAGVPAAGKTDGRLPFANATIGGPPVQNVDGGTNAPGDAVEIDVYRSRTGEFLNGWLNSGKEFGE